MTFGIKSNIKSKRSAILGLLDHYIGARPTMVCVKTMANKPWPIAERVNLGTLI